MENEQKITGLSVVALVLSILSFFATMFVFGALAVIFALVEQKKSAITWIALVLGILSLINDFFIIASYM
jgi:hypothetical protein